MTNLPDGWTMRGNPYENDVEVTTCAYCGEESNNLEFYLHRDDLVCPTCFKKIPCDGCGELFNEVDLIKMDGDKFCKECKEVVDCE